MIIFEKIDRRKLLNIFREIYTQSGLKITFQLGLGIKNYFISNFGNARGPVLIKSWIPYGLTFSINALIFFE